jgi:hypothetical protein
MWESPLTTGWQQGYGTFNDWSSSGLVIGTVPYTLSTSCDSSISREVLSIEYVTTSNQVITHAYGAASSFDANTFTYTWDTVAGSPGDWPGGPVSFRLVP